MHFTVVDYPYPTFGPPGCAGDDTLKLRLSAALSSPSTMRFYVVKEDDTEWIMDATLTLYVGEAPTCPDPPNVVKATAPVVVGAKEQALDFQVDPYDGLWKLGWRRRPEPSATGTTAAA